MAYVGKSVFATLLKRQFIGRHSSALGAGLPHPCQILRDCRTVHANSPENVNSAHGKVRGCQNDDDSPGERLGVSSPSAAWRNKCLRTARMRGSSVHFAIQRRRQSLRFSNEDRFSVGSRRTARHFAEVEAKGPCDELVCCSVDCDERIWEFVDVGSLARQCGGELVGGCFDRFKDRLCGRSLL